MAKFGNLSGRKLGDKTAWMDLPWDMTGPDGPIRGALLVRPAIREANRDYLRHMFRIKSLSDESQALESKGNQGPDEQFSIMVRLEDSMKEAAIDSVVVGWRDVYDEDGNLVEFSRAEFESLVSQAPEIPSLLDEVIRFASNPENFGIPSAKDVEDLAKKSAGG